MHTKNLVVTSLVAILAGCGEPVCTTLAIPAMSLGYMETLEAFSKLEASGQGNSASCVDKDKNSTDPGRNFHITFETPRGGAPLGLVWRDPAGVQHTNDIGQMNVSDYICRNPDYKLGPNNTIQGSGTTTFIYQFSLVGTMIVCSFSLKKT